MTGKQLNAIERLKAMPMTSEQFNELIRYDKRCYQNVLSTYRQWHHKDPTDDDVEASAEHIAHKQLRTTRKILKQPLHTSVVVELMDYDNSLTHFLLNIGMDIMDIEKLILQYYLGSTIQGKTVCWRFVNDGAYNANETIVDLQGGDSMIVERPTLGTPVNANIITFNERSGEVEEHHRIYQDDPFLTDDNFGIAFFGGHLLGDNKYKFKPVAVVWEELTALLGAHVNRNFLWLAVGCGQNLTAQHLQLLNGRNTVLCPNDMASDTWKTIATQFTNVSVSDMFTSRDANTYFISHIKEGNIFT